MPAATATRGKVFFSIFSAQYFHSFSVSIGAMQRMGENDEEDGIRTRHLKFINYLTFILKSSSKISTNRNIKTEPKNKTKHTFFPLRNQLVHPSGGVSFADEIFETSVHHCASVTQTHTHKPLAGMETEKTGSCSAHTTTDTVTYKTRYRSKRSSDGFNVF